MYLDCPTSTMRLSSFARIWIEIQTDKELPNLLVLDLGCGEPVQVDLLETPHVVLIVLFMVIL